MLLLGHIQFFTRAVNIFSALTGPKGSSLAALVGAPT